MATEIETLEAKIAKLELQPEEIDGDTGRFKQRKLKELRDQLEYLRGREITTEDGGGKIPGLRWGKVIPPGAQ